MACFPVAVCGIIRDAAAMSLWRVVTAGGLPGLPTAEYQFGWGGGRDCKCLTRADLAAKMLLVATALCASNRHHDLITAVKNWPQNCGAAMHFVSWNNDPSVLDTKRRRTKRLTI